MKHPLEDFAARLDSRRGDLLSILGDACPRGRAFDGEAAWRDLVGIALGFVPPSSQRPDPREVAREAAVAEAEPRVSTAMAAVTAAVTAAAAAPRVRAAAAAVTTTSRMGELLAELGKLNGRLEVLNALPASAFTGRRGRVPLSSFWLSHVGLLATIYRRHTGRKPANASFSPSTGCRYINEGFPALLQTIIEVSRDETLSPDQIYNLIRKAREIHPERFA